MDFQEVTRQKLESEGQPLVVHKQIYNPLLVMVIVHILFSICSKQTKGFNYLSKVGDGIHQQKRMISPLNLNIPSPLPTTLVFRKFCRLLI
jgi:hypothetical protein